MQSLAAHMLSETSFCGLKGNIAIFVCSVTCV